MLIRPSMENVNSHWQFTPIGHRFETIILDHTKSPPKVDSLYGRNTDTATEPNLDTLYNLLLNYKLLKSKLLDLNQLVANLIKSEIATKKQFLL